MASTRSRHSSFSATALLALAALACQSNDGGDAGDDPDEERAALSATEREPPAAVAVRARDDGAASEASDDASDEPPSEADPKPEPDEPASEQPPSDEPVVQAATFAACLDGGGVYSDCETIFVTAVLADPERCVQLTIDNCGTYGRQGLSADTPTGWRLASGSVSDSAAPCELGAFYASSSSLRNATGTITWDLAAPSPTNVSLDLALELGEDTLPLATSVPLEPAACEE